MVQQLRTRLDMKISAIIAAGLLFAVSAHAESPYQRYIDQCDQTLNLPTRHCGVGGCSWLRFEVAECTAKLIYPHSSPDVRSECAKRADEARIRAHLPLAYYSVDEAMRCVARG
jgi:hypothetical protein